MNTDETSTEDTQSNALIPVQQRKIAIVTASDSHSVELKLQEAHEKVREMLADQAATTLAPALFKSWGKAMKKGDTKAMRDVAEAIGLLQPKGGINIMNQVNNNNSVQAPSNGPSLESIIKKISKERYEDPPIIDAEFSDT